MPKLVVSGAPLQCSFGAAPSVLTAIPLGPVISAGPPVATINDHKPMVNILPFGMCTTPTNPAVAAATSAALGVLTPVPCMPVVSNPWAPGCPKVGVNGVPALTATCKCTCAWGGIIQITAPGQVLIDCP